MSIKAAFAKGSMKNLKIQWESYMLFCLYFKLVAFPASTETLCLFAQFLSRSFLAVDSVKNYICGVKIAHKLLDLEFTQIDKIELKLCLRGLARLKPHMVKQSKPITPSILKKIGAIMDFSKPHDITYWCLFLFAFFSNG